MSPPRLTLFSLSLLLALSTSASAQRVPSYRPAPGVTSPGIDQAIYKGIVGNVLDGIPMDPLKRVDLQRANAIISNTASGRSLAILVGLTNPVLLIGGLIWGVWAASNIKAAELETKVTANSAPTDNSADIQGRLIALAAPPAAAEDAPQGSVAEPILISLNAIGDTDEPTISRPRVVKIWLPQRSAMLAQ